MRTRHVAALGLVIASAACSSSSTTISGPPHPAALSVVRGAGQQDTVQSTLPTALTVSVTGSNIGQPTVQFIAVLLDTTITGSDSAEAYVLGDTATAQPQVFYADTINHSGQATTFVMLGTRAGRARIIVRVPELGLVDTVAFTAQAGAAAHVVVAPIDTTVYVASHSVMRATVTDRLGNPRTDPVTLRSSAPPVASVSGTTLGAQAYGVASIIGTSGTLTDTARVTVVPIGVLAGIYGTRGVYVVNLDGSRLRQLAPWPAETPHWAPSGAVIAFDPYVGGYNGSLIQTVDTLGNVQQLGVDPGEEPTEMGPQYSRDGQWVYFTEYSPDGGQGVIYKVSTAGGATPQTALAVSHPPNNEVEASPSPDGTQYVCRVSSGPTSLAIVTIATVTVTTLPVDGMWPVWSPNSNMIAFVGTTTGQVGLIASDGTGLRMVGAANTSYNSVDWSPDGQWLVAANATTTRLDLINASSGLVLPLDYSTGFTFPTWRPVN